MNKCKRYLYGSTLVTLYYSFVYPYLNYCNSIWGSTCQVYLDPLVKLQKRAIRIICNADRRSHTEPLFKRLGVLTLSKLFIYCTGLFMFKFHHSLIVWKRLEEEEIDENMKQLNQKFLFNHPLLPHIFRQFFKKNNSIHSNDTKQSNHMHLYGAKTSPKNRCIRIIGANIYNHFYDKLDMNCKFKPYKFHLKRYLIDNDVLI